MTELLQTAGNFRTEGEAFSCVDYGTGHIHKTYLLETGSRKAPSRYILQLINSVVFRKPEAVQDNIQRILDHFKKYPVSDSGFVDLEMIETGAGRISHVDKNGNYWRCFRYIENSCTLEKVDTPEQAYEGGRSFGAFLSRLENYNPRRLHITIPNFMDAEWRLSQLKLAEFTNPGARLKQVQPELKRIRELSGIAEDFLKIRMALPDRVVHNDTKITNVLFDADSGKGKCVIDLDTVMTGTLLTDFGDMVRSYTVPGSEDATSPDSWVCREDVFGGLYSGFHEAVAEVIKEVERAYLLLGAKLVIYLQAIRFLTDYLNGDVYYRTEHQQHNLDRTRNQLGQLESLLEKENLLQDILNRAV